MTLTLHAHPLASYCWKALLALYENQTPFDMHLVDLGSPEARDAFLALSPMGKMPVLRDDARNQTVPESSIIIEYLERHYPGPRPLIPADPDGARAARLADRFYDHHVHDHLQKIVGDRLRANADKDSYGVAQARAMLRSAYAVIDRDMATRTWATGDLFGMGDCAAAPALFYANKVEPIGEHARVAAYLDRLMARPSMIRVLAEAEPYFAMFPSA